MRRSLAFLSFLFLLEFPLLAQEPSLNYDRCLPVNDVSLDKLPFQAGEDITMICSYVWGITTDVGEVRFKLSHRHDSLYGECFQADGLIATRGLFRKFFKVNDIYQSKFSMTNLRPFYYMRDVHEGRYTIENYYHYNPDYSINAKIIHKSGAVTDTLLPGRICTFDLITLVYFARSLDMSNMTPGETLPVSFAIDEDIFNIYLRFDRREIKRVQGYGTFRTLRFSAQVVAGVVFTGKEELVLWVTDDENHLPLIIESPIIIGKIIARLGACENLKYPLTSKIK